MIGHDGIVKAELEGLWGGEERLVLIHKVFRIAVVQKVELCIRLQAGIALEGG